MSGIILNKLSNSKNTQAKPWLYKDISLDLKYDENKNDVMASFDERAVRNSLINLFNTRPGQNFLFPQYGLNLAGNLFEPLTESKGNYIGETILSTIERFEPRVFVESVSVEVNFEDLEYVITIRLFVPSINKYLSVTPVFSENGFRTVN
jgi:phage baseplate assembly protein W